MPSFPIIDSHVHLWDPQVLRYPWLDSIVLLNRPYLLRDYREATNSLKIDKMIFVQCEADHQDCEKEVAWVTELALQDNRIEGIVAWAPLEKGAAAKEILDGYAQNKLVKGIRRIIQFEPDPEFCLKQQFIQGVQLLEGYNFSFDICVSYRQLGHVIELVKLCPNVQFVLDHLGKPDVKNAILEPWRSQLRKLSQFKNVYCKLSGLVTEADYETWTNNDLTDFIQYALDYFTADRLMFGGDWPVVLQAANLHTWVMALERGLSHLSQEDLLKIYRTNAAFFYKLN